MRHRTPLWVGVVRNFTLGVFGAEAAEIPGYPAAFTWKTGDGEFDVGESLPACFSKANLKRTVRCA